MVKEVQLPDFDDMVNLAGSIGTTKTKLETEKADYDILRADITNYVMNHKELWDNGKVPSTAHIHDTYHIVGYDEETRKALDVKRKNIATLSGYLDELELKFKIWQAMIDVWRTESANLRNSLL